MAQAPKDDVSKQRMKLHMKVLGPSGSSQHLKEHKPTYKEKYVPPQMSMISYFMAKVSHLCQRLTEKYCFSLSRVGSEYGKMLILLVYGYVG